MGISLNHRAREILYFSLLLHFLLKNIARSRVVGWKCRGCIAVELHSMLNKEQERRKILKKKKKLSAHKSNHQENSFLSQSNFIK